MKSIKILRILGCALLAFGISACGDSSDSSSDEIIVQKDINGLSQKGPFIKGSAVHLYELDPVNLNQTGNIFTGKINSDEGDFIIKGINLKSSYALFETSGYYRNEVTGKKSSGTLTLNAISDLSDRNQVNINLLTHLEFERVRHLVGGDVSISEAKDQAESEIIASFGGNKASSNFEDLNIFEKNDENAMLLAISILLQGDRSEAELSDLLADYASDIEKDGKWDNEKAKKEIATWALNKIGNEELAVFRKNIEGWKYGSVPNFEKYIVNYVNFIFGCNKKSIGDTLELESGFIFRCAENKDGSFYYESLKSGLNSKTPWTAKAGASFPVVIGDKKFTGFWSYHNNPSSEFIWPAPIGKGIDSLQGVIDACGGVCGKGKFGLSEDVYMGMTLNFSNEEKEQPVDISSWQGICVESEGIINIELKPSDEENFTWYGNYYYRVTNKGIIDIPWEYFTQPSWFGKKVDLEESLKRTVAFKLRFEQSDGNPNFSLKAIGPMGTCGKATIKPVKPESRPGYDYPGYEYPDYQEVIGPEFNTEHLWSAADGSSFSIKASGEEYTASWYYYSDADNSEYPGGSKFIWPTELGNSYETTFDPIIEECGGSICGEAKFEMYMGLVLNFSDDSESHPFDITSWNGVCLESEGVFGLELKPSNEEFFTRYENHIYFIREDGVIDIPWEYFESPSGIPVEVALKRIIGLKFRFDADSKFKIKAVGPLGSCGTPTVEAQPPYNGCTDCGGGTWEENLEEILKKNPCTSNFKELDIKDYGTFRCYDGEWYYYESFPFTKERDEYLNLDRSAYGTFVDSRNGVSYATYDIGPFKWMAQDLNYRDSIKYPNLKGNTSCLNGHDVICEFEGARYTWTGAMNVSSVYQDKSLGSIKNHHQGICPDGWWLPDSNAYRWMELSKNYALSITHELWLSDEVPYNKSTEAYRTGFYWGDRDYRDGKYNLEMIGNGKSEDHMHVRCVTYNEPCDENNDQSIKSFGNKDDGYYAVCDNGSWRIATEWDLDINGRKCTEDFQEIQGNYDEGRTYRCYKGTWYEGEIFPYTKSRDEYLNQYGDFEGQYGTLIDTRDNQIYATTVIGPYKWMAQNLNYADSTQMKNLKENSWCAYDLDINCEIAGRLYSWTAAMNVSSTYQNRSMGTIEPHRQGICPAGWWLPDTTEFRLLEASNDEVDIYGFSAFRINYHYGSRSNLLLWSASEGSENKRERAFVLERNDEKNEKTSSLYEWWNGKNEGLAVRCVTLEKTCSETNDQEVIVLNKYTNRYAICDKNQWRTASELEADVNGRKCSKKFDVIQGELDISKKYVCYEGIWYSTADFPLTHERDEYLSESKEYIDFEDPRDHKHYATVDIGPYTWFAQNLNYTDSSVTQNLKRNVWCYANNPINCELGGALYSWTAAMDLDRSYLTRTAIPLNNEDHYQGVCPDGWRLPKEHDVELLYQSVDYQPGSLLSENTNIINAENTTNSSGLSVINTGFLHEWGHFEVRGEAGFWIAEESSENPKENAKSWYINSYYTGIDMNWNKKSGNPVRCVKLNTECNSENEGMSIDNFICREGQWTIN